MHNILIDKPYRFVPPVYGRFWQRLLQLALPSYLRKVHGLHDIQFEGLEAVRASLKAGHSVLLTPNHARPCDPMLLGLLSGRLNVSLYTMASWHLFMQTRSQAWLLPRVGAFSVYREGLDTAAVKEAVSILKTGAGPLIIFPEGLITRSNDCLRHLNDGPAFIARTAARQRAKASLPTVVIHPVAIRYSFGGDVQSAVAPVLRYIEERLTWQTKPDQSLYERIYRIGEALLSLKEMDYFGRAQTGTISERQTRLISHILEPLEQEWKLTPRDGDVPSRVRALRGALLPDIVEGSLDEKEKARRWRQLADLYLAQQLCLYPPDYMASRPTAERILETVERLEEDLTDRTRVHAPIKVRVRVGPAIEVPAEKAASPDPLLLTVRDSLESMLNELGHDAPLFAAVRAVP
jgi:1-acyl-sn-glycerol-3-phosphate acyltransferase